MHISELVVDDAKKLPTGEQMQARLNALETFARDRWLRGDDSSAAGPGGLPDLADLARTGTATWYGTPSRPARTSS